MLNIGIPIYKPDEEIFLETMTSVLNFRDLSSFKVEICASIDFWPLQKSFLARWGKFFEENSIRFISHDNNLGMGGNWNSVLDLFQEQYGMIIGQDDIVTADPKKLARLFHILQDKCLNVAFIGRTIKAVGTSSPFTGFLNGRYIFELQKTSHLSSDEATKLTFGVGNVLGEPLSTIYDVKAVKELGGYDERIYCADVDLNLRLLRPAGCIVSIETSNTRVIHSSNLTKEALATGAVNKEWQILAKRYLKREWRITSLLFLTRRVAAELVRSRGSKVAIGVLLLLFYFPCAQLFGLFQVVKFNRSELY